MECTWCGLSSPITEDGRLEIGPVFVVEKFNDPELAGDYHRPCFDRMFQFNRLRKAVRATGWKRSEFLENVELLASELEE